MEEHFYIFCFLSLAIVAGVSIFLILQIKKEWDLYRLFSSNGDMRALLAKDPKRFHISIVYLMTYMIHSNGDNTVQYDKLHMIVRYIVEVIPLEYQVDAIKALKYLTDREKGQGKSRVTESVVDVSRFKSGKYLSCIKKVDDSYHYSHDIHGTKMAEELGLYLPENDRWYIVYLLYRLSILDGVITKGNSFSESAMLKKICVQGFKLKIDEFYDLIDSFANKTDQIWYDKHFADKDGYPTSDLLGNVFRVDIDELASIKKKMPKTSVLPSILNVQLASLGILYFVFIICAVWAKGPINYIYPNSFYWIGSILTFVTIGFCIFLTVKKLDSSIIPLLRTEIESSLQKQYLNKLTISGGITIILLNFCIPNLFLLLGNETFSNGESFNVTVPVTGTDYHTYKNSTTYYVNFPTIDFSKFQFPESQNEKTISTPNKICLDLLKTWSGMNLFGVKHYKSISSKSVSHNDYLRFKNEKFQKCYKENIRLFYKYGYYGMYFKSGYELTTDPISNPNQADEFGEVDDVNPEEYSEDELVIITNEYEILP